jgi:DNA-binding protein HU-beta
VIYSGSERVGRVGFGQSFHFFRFQGNNLIFAVLNLREQEIQTTQTYLTTMTKADIVSRIADATGMEKHDVQTTVEAFMTTVRESLESGENVYLRGFGSFVIKTRAAKTGRNILAKKSIQIPAHNIPSFKPAREFVDNVKENVKVEA